MPQLLLTQLAQAKQRHCPICRLVHGPFGVKGLAQRQLGFLQKTDLGLLYAQEEKSGAGDKLLCCCVVVLYG